MIQRVQTALSKTYPAIADIQLAMTLTGLSAWQVMLLTKSGLLHCVNLKKRFAVKKWLTVSLLRSVNSERWKREMESALSNETKAPGKSPSRRRRSHQDDLSNPDDQAHRIGSSQWIVNTWLARVVTNQADGTFIPALLNDEELSRIFGLAKHDLPTLRKIGHLTAVNGNQARAKKLHEREYVIGLVTNVQWLTDAVLAVNEKWASRNHGKNDSGSDRDGGTPNPS